ncbi:pilus assembly protein [Palleronia sp. LCG004]|uniref:pilus assembly protein n=1 Tax=Palleronia sp. LCG004 TaxID=3079304 RepID=UPI002941F6D4|nr:pilus assembly protein [Palleronia sp. LCG004]WOI55689.1 pilus assembly protein [Palleronia sp. LCG004]
MNISKLLKTFCDDESGAVTVDWVVLTAAIVGLAIAISTTLFGNVEKIATNINSELGNASLQTIDKNLDGN